LMTVISIQAAVYKRRGLVLISGLDLAPHTSQWGLACPNSPGFLHYRSFQINIIDSQTLCAVLAPTD
jgi:hypothetical protein